MSTLQARRIRSDRDAARLFNTKSMQALREVLWKIYDNNQGLNEDISRSKAREIVGAEKKPRHKPTERHAIIAEIAQELGANVSEQDVKTIFAATRVEYEERTGKVAAGGKARAMA